MNKNLFDSYQYAKECAVSVVVLLKSIYDEPQKIKSFIANFDNSYITLIDGYGNFLLGYNCDPTSIGRHSLLMHNKVIMYIKNSDDIFYINDNESDRIIPIFSTEDLNDEAFIFQNSLIYNEYELYLSTFISTLKELNCDICRVDVPTLKRFMSTKEFSELRECFRVKYGI